MVDWFGVLVPVGFLCWLWFSIWWSYRMTQDREPIWPKLEDYDSPKATTPWGKLPIKPKPQDKKD